MDSPEEAQGERDLVLGQAALGRGHITPGQLKEALIEQAREAAGGDREPRPLGQILVAKGFLSGQLLIALLKEQVPQPVEAAPLEPEPAPPSTVTRRSDRRRETQIRRAPPRPRSRKYAIVSILGTIVVVAMAFLLVTRTPSVESELAWANQCLASGDHDEALRTFEIALAKSPSNAAAREGRERAQAAIREKQRPRPIPVKPAPPVPAEPAAPVVLQLLDLIDPVQDAVGGSWSREDGKLVAAPGPYGRIEIPYRPPEEYDLRAVFTRLEGIADVSLIALAQGRAFMWVAGARRNTAFGFDRVGGKMAEANPTTVAAEACLENGRTHTMEVRVRRDGVEGRLDGRLISRWTAASGDLDMRPDWKLRDARLMGLGTHESRTVFERVELIEVTGKGARTR